MANSNKFVSVNLNKSYGNTPQSSSYSRSRPGFTGGGGGGKTVLSRPRSSGPGAPTKLSVPPPLNLPSRRKEHEGLDSATGSGSSTRPGSAGVGSGATAAMGWTKPASFINSDPPAYTPPRAAVLLRGEDFPSLGAVAPVVKQRDTVKERAVVDMRPQVRSIEKDVGVVKEKVGKEEGNLPGPMPIVRVSQKSDWADDERDTGLSIPERERGFGRSDSDSFRRDVGVQSREGRDGNSWRTPLVRDGFMGGDRDRVGGGAGFGGGREMGKESGYNHLSQNGQDGYGYGVRRDVGARSGMQNGRNVVDGYNGRGDDQNQRGRYGDFSDNRLRGDGFQNSTISRNTFSSGSKGFSLNDPILNFGKDKRVFSNNAKPYLDDGGVDSTDSFSGGLFGEINAKVLKKKKDALKQTDFHDPVRDSFEAELEKVQRAQEMERQRAMDEQNRAIEHARREHEERERLVREEEERRRRIEEEVREAAWRAEQEKLESVRKAEAQKIAREEEKKRIFLEEERRKEAARKKLLELEARMAKRHGEGNLKDDKLPPSVTDERPPVTAKERDPERAADIGEWEDGERMVERITSTASSDSSIMNQYLDTGSRPHSVRDGNSSFERGKHANTWRRDTDNSTMVFPHDQENNYHSLRRETLNATRGYPRKETHGNFGAPARPISKGVQSEALQAPDDLRYSRHRWNIADGDYFNKNADSDTSFLESDKFGDAVWGPSHSRGSTHAPFAERPYQTEIDEFSTFGRSRTSLRQPRVLPPPSVSTHKSPFRAVSEYPSSSSFLETGMSYQHSGKAPEASYDPAEMLQQPATEALLAQSPLPLELNADKNTLRCDSQSSLSVSSPPSSPTHLSQEELDESEDFQRKLICVVGEQTVQSDSDHMVLSLETEDAPSHGDDDEWATGNHEILQEQEEYDEDEDGYHEEEEAHDVNTDNFELGLELENIQSEVLDTSDEGDQVVLGFDDGVQVNIPIIDEVEKASRNTSTDVVVQAYSVGAKQEQILSDSVEAENNSSKLTNETDKSNEDLVPHPVTSTSYTNTQENSSSELLSSDLSSSFSDQPILSSASASSAQPVLSPVSTVVSQPELPYKLQFGLFSGPSLFPSHIPAIQIGSIQMPLHLHPQVGPSVSQVHSPPPPLLQFGQLSYTPLVPQTVSFAQPSPSHYSFNQNLARTAQNQESRESFPLNNPTRTPVDKPQNVSRNSEQRQMNVLPDPPRNEVARHNQTSGSSFVEVRSRYGSTSHTDRHSIRDITVKKNYRPMANNIESQFPAEHNPSGFFCGERYSGGKPAGMVSGSRGRRFYAVRYVGSRTSFSGPDVSPMDSSGFQRRPRRNVRRTEFRVRESSDKRHTEAVEQFNVAGQDSNLNSNANTQDNTARYQSSKDASVNKVANFVADLGNLNSGTSGSRVVLSDSKPDKVTRKDTPSKKRMPSVHNLYAGDDVPLQSNVVRVFNQPGIEAASDDDDFIQVRSKRQMLNDRREQREKEMKAMSMAAKAPRKTRAVAQSNVVQSKPNRAVSSSSGHRTENVAAGAGVGVGRGFASAEASPVFTANIASQSLPPIGTPSPSVGSSSKSKNQKSSKTSTSQAISSGGAEFMPDLLCESNNRAFDIASVPLVSWGNADVNQQVMALTQSQLDEAMQPARVDSHTSSSNTRVPIKPSSIMMQEKTFSSSSSPLNSMLAGQTIQFGAVTVPTMIPPVSRTMSDEVGPPALNKPNIGITPKLPTSVNECAFLSDKETRPGKSCANIKDPEAEAEAAASAVAVAAISSNDETVGSRLSACSASASDMRNPSTSDVITSASKAGVTGSQEVTGQSAAEDSLAVSLPADLSVDTLPSLPLWPLPSPHSSSAPLLSHFPGAPPSHFPCFEMNPMLGGAVFAFGPQDESAGTQAQQISTTLGSGPIGGWPQCHSTIDSFYGPSTGYSGPFISPPGGIPGVQGPPHMVVYNHFAPVGQFGQVGLSFMGTTYIPTGKQPDWKHNPVSSAAGVGESVVNNSNVVSGPRATPSIHALQHMAPGSPLMQMGSPLTMFDMPSFQSAADVPMQARWSHIPVPPIHSISLSVPPPQHQVEGLPTQFGRGLLGDTSAGNNRFHEPRHATSGDSRTMSSPKNSLPQPPGQLAQVEPPSNATVGLKTSGPSGILASGHDIKVSNSSKNPAAASTSESRGNVVSSNNIRSQVIGSTYKPQAQQIPPSSGPQYIHGDQRGSGPSQKVASGGEWHRRMGYQGRNQTSGSDKNFSSSKVKQIYVAKTQSGNATTG